MGWTFAFKDPHESAADFLKRECLTWRLPPRECPEIVASATGANCIAFAVRFPAAYLALDPERKHFFIPDEDGSITTAILYLDQERAPLWLQGHLRDRRPQRSGRGLDSAHSLRRRHGERRRRRKMGSIHESVHFVRDQLTY